MRTTWSQPFRWGVLMAFDPESTGDIPELTRTRFIVASEDGGLSVAVRHSADVETPDDWPADAPIPEAEVTVTVLVDEPEGGPVAEFEAVLHCPSGRLVVGDAENERAVVVPRGRARVRVIRDHVEHAENVILRIDPARG